MGEFVPPHRAGQGVSAARLAGMPFKPLLNGRASNLQSGGSGLAGRQMARAAYGERNEMFSSTAFEWLGCSCVTPAGRLLTVPIRSSRGLLTPPGAALVYVDGSPP